MKRDSDFSLPSDQADILPSDFALPEIVVPDSRSVLNGGAAGPAPAAASGSGSDPASSGPAAASLATGSAFNINLVWDNSALNAPASFRAAVTQAAAILQSSFINPITVNIEIGYGEYANQTYRLRATALGDSLSGDYQSYSTLRSLLSSHATTAAATSAVNSLPDTTSLQGVSSFYVASAEEKALGLISGTSSALDGAVGLGTGLSGNELVSVALHEMAHSMGRLVGGNALDLFRYSGAGQHVLSSGTPAPAAYFSIDGGANDLADFGRYDDPSDFVNGGTQDALLNGAKDSFDELYDSTSLTSLSAVDRTLMNALGFTPAEANSPTDTADFNGDGQSDLVFQNATTGAVSIELQNGFNTTAFQLYGVDPSYHVAATGDFSGNGKSDVIFQNPTTGAVSIWQMNGLAVTDFRVYGVDPSFHVVGTGDFFGNGKSDVLFQNPTNGAISIWQMNGLAVSGYAVSGADPSFSIVGTGDFNGDGKSDILFTNPNTGVLSIWEMNGFNIAGFQNYGTDPSFHVVGTGDFNGDGMSDILFQNPNTGDVSIWEMNGFTFENFQNYGVDQNYRAVATGDYFGTGKSGITFQNPATGAMSMWQMNGLTETGFRVAGIDPNFHLVT